jgi:hypothetical protein
MEILEKDLEAKCLDALGGEFKWEPLPPEQRERYEERRRELYSGTSEIEMLVKEARALAASSTLILN